MMSLEYVLTTGVLVAAFGGLAILLMRTLVALTAIKSVIMALPVG